jgi:hypothetical protein
MIPSLLQIPSAVSDSKLHSVLPNNGKGDFQFDRSTGATRINRDGLIEEVGYFSSELVQNGNFSELGSEELTNGDFSSTSDWTITNNTGTETEIINGYVRIKTDGAYTQIRQFNVLSTGKTYKLVYDVIESDGGSLGLEIGGSTLLIPSTVGTHTFYWVSNASTFNIKRYGGALDIKIDNVSVKQVDPNNRWTLTTIKFTGANTFENTATNGKLNQSYTTVVGSKYKVSATINSGTWNVVASTNDNTGGQITSTGNTTSSEFFEFTATTTTTFILLYNIGASGSVASITDASVVEVQGDRPRLSYDITNGVVEDKPHLLLEPSSTNLVTYSQDISNSYWSNSNSTSISNTVIAPDGTLTADELVDNTSNGYHWIYKAGVQSNARISFFAKANQLSQVWVNGGGGSNFAGFDLLNGTITKQGGTANPKIEEYKNGWYRCSLTSDNSGVLIATMVNNDETYIGSGKSIYLWGIQAEALSYATSYIPTAGTTITRAAETCNNSKPSVNSTEGVLYAEIEALADDGTFRFISLNNGTFDNSVTIRLDSSTNRITAICRVGGANQATINYDYSSIDFYKVAFKYKANDFVLYANGVQIGSDTSGSVFSANTLNDLSFKRGDNVHNFYGKLKGLAVYNEALSESQLMQLTGVTALSIYNNFVTRTASFTVEALNEVKKVIDNL